MQPTSTNESTPTTSPWFEPSYLPARELCDVFLPEVTIEGQRYRVDDVAVQGLRFEASEALDMPQLAAAHPIVVSVGGNTVLEAEGKIARVKTNSKRSLWTVRFVGAHLDLKRLRREHERAVVQQRRTSPRIAERLVSAEYRSFCSDVVFMLRHYRALMDRIEAKARETSTPELVEEALDTLQEPFVAEWKRLWKRGGELVAPILGDRDKVRAYKQYSEAVLTPELIDGPVWRRSYEKPLGYPGDYRIMRYVYDWELEGSTGYAKLCHLVGLEVGKPVATRKTVVEEAIVETMQRRAAADTRMASIGCGPAYEVSQVLERTTPRGPTTFTLVDQDPIALKDAYERIFPLSQKAGTSVTVRYWPLTYKQLLRRNFDEALFPEQDLIYCVGLLDYLPTSHAQSLVTYLFDRLRPGGTLLIGNMKADTDNVWPLMFVLDWELIYRNEREMDELVAQVRPKDRRLILDSTGYNYLMFLFKE